MINNIPLYWPPSLALMVITVFYQICSKPFKYLIKLSIRIHHLYIGKTLKIYLNSHDLSSFQLTARYIHDIII